MNIYIVYKYKKYVDSIELDSAREARDASSKERERERQTLSSDTLNRQLIILYRMLHRAKYL